MTDKTMLAVVVSTIVVATVAHVIYWQSKDEEKKQHDPVRKVIKWLNIK